jgi:hypothetical protein
VPAPVLLPAGVSPASGEAGAALEPPGLPPVMRASLIDPATGERLSLTREAHPVDAAILRQFRTVFSSGVAVSIDGNKMRKIRKNDRAASTLIRVEIERIMAPFVDGKTARIDRIDIEAGEANGYVGAATLSYTNLATGRRSQVGPLTGQLAGDPA